MKAYIAKAPILIIVAVICSTVFASAAIQEYMNSHTFNNEFETAGVKVAIEQLQIKNEAVLPETRISYVPKVTNIEADSYVRVKFDYSWGGEKQLEIMPEMFFGIKEGWVEKDNYLYFTQVLKTGESQEVFDGIMAPNSNGIMAPNSDGIMALNSVRQEETTFSVVATVDAIQSSNFTPDFGSRNPWGNVEIQSDTKGQVEATALADRILAASEASQPMAASEASQPMAASEASQPVATSVAGLDFTYAHEGTFQCSTEDLFSKFNSFQPGDVCSEYLNMKNDSDKKMEVLFRTENNRTNLLDEMKLNITCCGVEVYRGSLTSQQLKQFITIGTIPSGQSGKIEFEISMPETADNSFAELKDNVKWIIAVREIDGAKKAEVTAPPIQNGTAQPLQVAETGDTMLPITIALLVITASLLIAVLVIYRRFCGSSSTDRKSE